jgi:DNA-binding NtrC family response regulator
MRVGSGQTQYSAARIIAATNRDLGAMVAEGKFREDLFHRLAVISIHLPPLRERCQDVDHLACKFLNRLNQEYKNIDGYQPKQLTDCALARLRSHNWPGNIRELHNVLKRVAVMAFSSQVSREDIDSAIKITAPNSDSTLFARARGDGFKLKDRLRKIESVYIDDAMRETGDNQTRAAELLGITQQALSKKLKK